MGTIQIDGSTPKITVGNATAEDATILFDGNAQDFYIALDDSADDLLIGKGSTVGTTPAIAIDENLKVNIPVTTASTSASTGSLTTGGGAGIGADLYVGDDVYLITDSAVLGFGADKDTLLTHTDGTGLTLNSTNKLCFNDASQFIQGSSNAILSLGATDEIDLTATAVDLNGTLDVSGNSQFSGTITVGVDDTGLDVKLFGATASSYMLWDESADSLSLIASTLGVVTAKDLGTGIHVRTADSGADVSTNADELVVENSSTCGISILSGNSQNGVIHFGDDGDNDIGNIDYDHSDNSMKFVTNAAERARFLGVGTFDMNVGGGTVNANYWTMKIRQNTSDVDQFYMMAFAKADDSTVGSIQSDGSNASFNTSSDYRLKENVVDLTGAIDKVKTLKPKRFNFKSNPSKTQDGFLAHEVTAVPEAVSGEKDAMIPEVLYADEVLYNSKDELPEGKNIGDVKHSIGDVKEETRINPQQLDQSKLVPLLVASIIELEARVKTLEG